MLDADIFIILHKAEITEDELLLLYAGVRFCHPSWCMGILQEETMASAKKCHWSNPQISDDIGKLCCEKLPPSQVQSHHGNYLYQQDNFHFSFWKKGSSGQRCIRC